MVRAGSPWAGPVPRQVTADAVPYSFSDEVLYARDRVTAPQGIDIDSRIFEVRLLVHFAIESARLALQPMCTADIDALGRIANEPGVRRYLFDDQPVTRAFIRAVLAQSVSNFEERLFGIWTMREKDVDALIGFCGLRRVQDLGEVEIL
jgi:RimJ/RimL family protein N-acetyltransferase